MKPACNIRLSITGLLLLACMYSSYSQDSLTLFFPCKDGYIAADTCSGDQKELIIDEEKQSIGWLSCKKHLIDFNKVKTAMLMLHIKEVNKNGLCGIFSLMTRVDAPENRVRLSMLRFDDMPLYAVPLDSSYTDQIIPLDITEIMKARKFNGIVIRSMNGLSAKFASKEGVLPPAIVLLHGSPKPEPVSWFSGTDVPDSTTGKTGDFFVRTSSGVIYHRTGPAWDSVAVLAVPPEKPVVKPPVRKTARMTGVKKRPVQSSTAKKR
jgi:hypothetical protein